MNIEDTRAQRTDNAEKSNYGRIQEEKISQESPKWATHQVTDQFLNGFKIQKIGRRIT